MPIVNPPVAYSENTSDGQGGPDPDKIDKVPSAKGEISEFIEGGGLAGSGLKAPDVKGHLGSKANPHEVTASQAGAEPAFEVLAVGKGGTGQATVESARNALGLGNTTGALPVANGGTNATTAAGARANLEVARWKGVGATEATTVSWNDITIEGVHPRLMHGALNPDGNGVNAYYHVMVFAYAADNIRQLAIPYRTSDAVLGSMYVRASYNGVWDAFQRIHAGVVPEKYGGTGATTAAGARANLGAAADADVVKKTGAQSMAGPLHVSASSNGEITAYYYTTMSSNGSGRALFGNNCYLDGAGNFAYRNTHASLGARGIVLGYLTPHSVHRFDTGSVATVAGAAFTPTLVPIATGSPVVMINANTTLSLSHAGCFLWCKQNNVTITIPADATTNIPIDTEIEICRGDTTTVTIAAASGVTIDCADAARTIRTRFKTAAIKKVGANEWLLQGDLG